jgi:hypothetical protein
VPLRVQQRLATLYPDAAFVPERLPPGYRYESWGRDVGLYDIAFVKGPADDVQREITFSVDSTPYVAPGLQGANPNDAFHIDGHTVYWVGGSHFDNSAWRWVRSGGRSLRITAANATARTDAILVGSARRVK